MVSNISAIRGRVRVRLTLTLPINLTLRFILTVIAVEPRSGKSSTYFVVGDGVEHLGDFPGSGHRINDWTWTGRSIDFHRWNHLLWHELRMLHTTMKKRSDRRKHCALVVVRRSQKFSPPRRRPLPGGAGQPKFNHLEIVTTFTYKPSLVRIDACNFELSW